TGEQVAEYAGQDLVVFEYLTLGGDPVAEHTDPNDGEQTFTVEEEPDEPEEPGDPDDPDEPGDPDDPEKPGDPGDPDDPEQPGDPGDSEQPKDSTDLKASGNLPQTGADMTWPFIAGGVLLLASGGTLLLMRRKNHA